MMGKIRGKRSISVGLALAAVTLAVSWGNFSARAASTETSVSTAQKNAPEKDPFPEVKSVEDSYPPKSDKHKAANRLLAEGHYDDYVKMLETAGAEGDMDCQTTLSYLYDSGRIVVQDHAKAREILEGLARKKFGLGTAFLGNTYEQDYGDTKADLFKAMQLYVQSAEEGSDSGVYGMAHLLCEAPGFKHDFKKALTLTESLCEKQSPLGWLLKFKIYHLGLGVQKDNPAAIKFLEKAAIAGLPIAQAQLADEHYFGDDVPTNYKLARFWAEKAAAQQNINGQLRLAYMKMHGLGFEKDCAGGIDILSGLANQSILEAQNRLGSAYHFGTCVEKDLDKAKEWLEKAASRNYTPSLNELANMYMHGDGVPKDLAKFYELNLRGAREKRASESNRAACEYNVGLAFDHGWGVKKDKEQARAWYSRAVSGGNPHACNNLSLMYQYGSGVAVDTEKAMSLRRLGVKNGCWMACNNLARDYLGGYNGVKKNIPEAIKMFKKGISLVEENPIAYFRLGTIYDQGLGAIVDKKLAKEYLAKAKKYGSEEAFGYGALKKVTTLARSIVEPAHHSKSVLYPTPSLPATFFIFIPADYSAKEKYGLVVNISTSDRDDSVPDGWMKVLHDKKLLFVCPQQAGNQVNTNLREGLVVQAAMRMMHRYNIDKDRVYASGLLGGARTACDVAFHQSDIFKGVIAICGAEYPREVKKLNETTDVDGPDTSYGITSASAQEITDAKTKVKFALVTGKDDFRRGNVLNIFHDGFETDGYKAKLIEVDEIGKNYCDGKTFEQALQFIK